MSFGKHCTRCDRDFHPSAFYPHHSWCKACMRLWVQRYRRALRRVYIRSLVAR